MMPGAANEKTRIDEQAITWVMLTDERPLTAQEEREFTAWCNADPRHEARYHALLETWDDVPAGAKVLAVDGAASNVLPFAPPLVVGEADSLRPRRIGRWAIAIGAVAAILLAFIALPQLTGPAHPSFETALAEQRVLKLDDGSVVTLGPKSKLEVAFTGDARRVTLSGGEAFFEVAHNANRPFLVRAGDLLVRVVGTKFDVNLGGRSVRVSVLEGVVHVTNARADGPKTVRVLRKGQRTEVDLAAVASVEPSTAGLAPPSQIIAQSSQPPGAWREGRLMYDNVRLADLVADLNRYYAPGVKLADPSLGDLRVTAFFSSAEIPAFLTTLPDVAAVKTEKDASGAVRVERP